MPNLADDGQVRSTTIREEIETATGRDLRTLAYQRFGICASEADTDEAVRMECFVRMKQLNPEGNPAGADRPIPPNPVAPSRSLSVKIDMNDMKPHLEKAIQERLEPVKKAQEAALSLLRDLPTRALDVSMRARVLEVERVLVESIRPNTTKDKIGADHAKDKAYDERRRGDACAKAVAAYDD